MKVYVAGSSATKYSLERAADVMKQLTAMGHVVTHDWVASVNKVGEGNPVSSTREERRGWAQACVQGISDADIFVILHDQWSSGSLVELGIALSAHPSKMRKVIFIGSDHLVVFSAWADLVFTKDEDFLTWASAEKGEP